MKKTMESVTVYVSEKNEVCIERPSDEDIVIFLNPHQIDTVIEWLKEAKSEALKNEVPSKSE